MIHLYTGDGKGKTTAALGLILRAAGHGKRAVLAQFCKGRLTGELNALKLFDSVTVLRNTKDYGFYGTASEAGRAAMKRENEANLKKAFEIAASGLCDLLVLDEICPAFTNGAVDRELAERLIKNIPAGVELVLTGRNAPPGFLDAADYITEFKKLRHPYDRGEAAREGIEF